MTEYFQNDVHEHVQHILYLTNPEPCDIQTMDHDKDIKEICKESVFVKQG